MNGGEPDLTHWTGRPNLVVAVEGLADPMPVVAIHHVQLAMPPGGEELARRFYRDLLGIPEVPKPAHLAGRGGCWFEHGALRLHLGVETDFRPARKAHPALIATELDTLLETLAAAGHGIRREPQPRGPDQIYVDDPFGNRIEFVGADS